MGVLLPAFLPSFDWAATMPVDNMEGDCSVFSLPDLSMFSRHKLLVTGHLSREGSAHIFVCLFSL